MTCIVGIAQGGKVYIAGDSAGVAGLDMAVRADEKVFTNGEFIFGCTSSFRMIQLLRYSLVPPKRHPEEDVMKFMVTTFMDSVRHCLRTGGYMRKANDSEEIGTFLVGYQGRLFRVCDDMQIGERVEEYDACGCGMFYALGSLFNSSEVLGANGRLEQALRTAEHFSAGVRAPFVYVQN